MEKNFTKQLGVAALSVAIALPTVATAAISSDHSSMKEKMFRAAQASKKSAVKTYAEETPLDPIIMDRPEGKASEYAADGVLYFLSWSGVGMDEFSMEPSEIVEAENGEVFIHNILADTYCPGWVKGTRDGDVITIPLPQIVEEMEFGEEVIVYCVDYLKCVDKEYLGFDSFEVDRSVKSITMTATEEGGWHLDLPDNGDAILGLTSGEGGENWWIGYADVISEWHPVPWQRVDASGLKFDQYAMVSDSMGSIVGFARDGSDVYLKGVSKYFPDAVVKGTVENGRAVFDSYQYLGIADMKFGFFLGSKYDLIIDEYYGDEYYGYVPVEAAVFDFDETNQSLTMTEEGAIYVTGSISEMLPFEILWMPVFYSQPEYVTPEPMAPTFAGMEEWSEYNGYGTVAFNVSNLNAEGYVLDSDRTYYVVEQDGVPMESPAHLAFDDSEYLIPLRYIDWDLIRGWDSLREIRIYDENVKTVSVYLVYIDEEGVRHESDKLLIILDPTEVGSMSAQPDDAQIYDLTGMRVANPHGGVYIRVQDGKTSKVTIR